MVTFAIHRQEQLPEKVLNQPQQVTLAGGEVESVRNGERNGREQTSASPVPTFLTLKISTYVPTVGTNRLAGPRDCNEGDL
jgi:hypothetical protein